MADRNGFAAQGGIVALLDGRKKSIHVDVDDFARGVVFKNRFGDRHKAKISRLQGLTCKTFTNLPHTKEGPPVKMAPTFSFPPSQNGKVRFTRVRLRKP